MPQSPLNTAGRSRDGKRNAADHQTTLTKYFSPTGNVTKRIRRNLTDAASDDSVTQCATTSGNELQKNPGTENDSSACDKITKTRHDSQPCLERDTTPVSNSQSSAASTAESCDLISPSPVSTSHVSLTLNGTLKRRSDSSPEKLCNDAADQVAVTKKILISTSHDTGLNNIDVAEQSKPVSGSPSKGKFITTKQSHSAADVSDRTHNDQTHSSSKVRGKAMLCISQPAADTSSKTLMSETERGTLKHTISRSSSSSSSVLSDVLPDSSRNDSDDTQQYSLPVGYRSTRLQRMDKTKKWKNVDFYMNKIESVPRGAKIEEILQRWKGDYYKLEIHHGYIQWLFPISDTGMNLSAQPLQADEAEFLKSDRTAQDRLIRAYRMMLDFFGIELINEGTGKLQRASNWKERMAHLNSSSHNFLRITRILKCFCEVGLERLQVPLIRFLISEVFIRKTLRNCQRSCRLFWVPTLQDEDTRHKLQQFVERLNVR